MHRSYSPPLTAGSSSNDRYLLRHHRGTVLVVALVDMIDLYCDDHMLLVYSVVLALVVYA